MIMCDPAASGITGEVADSYLVRVDPTPHGGALVLWSDEPDQAMVFDDAASAAEFCRTGPLTLFVVSFVPVAATSAAPPRPPLPPSPKAEPVNLADEMRAMGLM
jgi:hypothetical protein